MLPPDVEEILCRLEKAGYETWAVGGCVRDNLRGTSPQDFDLTTACPPDTLLALFPGSLPTGLAYGTVTVLTPQRPVEVTVFRAETASNDHRHPAAVKAVSSVTEDLIRRDFTVNAMAWHPTRGLYDPTGGRQDLAERRLRAVGDPARRFEEDALRILRGYRFASALGWDLDPATRAAALDAAPTLAALPSERVTGELQKLLIGQRPSVLAELIAAGGLRHYGLYALRDAERLDRLPASLAWRLAGLCYLSSSPIDLTAWRFSRALQAETEGYVSLLQSPLPATAVEIKRQYRRLAPSDWPTYCRARTVLTDEDTDAVRCLWEQTSRQPYDRAGLALSGQQLAAHGLRGAEIGRALDELVEWVWEHPEQNTADELLAHLFSSTDTDTQTP